MSFKANLLVSVLLHIAIVGAVAAVWLRRADPPQSEEKIVEIYFEVVEESELSEAPEPHESPPPPEEDATPQPPVEAPAVVETPIPVVVEPPPEQQPDEPPPQQIEPPSPPSDPLPPQLAVEERASVVTEAFALNRITPKYPRSARRKGHEGKVTVEVSISPSGAIAESSIFASSGFPELDDAALSAVRTAQFSPATQDGVGVVGRLRMTFEFRLQ